MKPDRDALPKPQNMRIPEGELLKTPEMQIRRELSLLYQEAAIRKKIPMYGVLSVDTLNDLADLKQLSDILPEAKAAILIGAPIDDPWLRLWHRVGGVSMKHFTTVATSKVEVMLLTFAEMLEIQGYKAVIRQLPLTPTNQHTRIFELAGAGFTGKNHMVVTEKYGCRANLGFIVTDAPLLHGDYRYEPYVKNLCGDCTLCEEYCPSGALINGQYDSEKCQVYIDNPAHQLSFSPHTVLKCDACMRICPLGSAGRWDSKPVKWTTILEEKQINY